MRPLGSWYETEMGTPKTNADLFRDRSPIHGLALVRAPLMVFQGANDTNVPKAESDVVVAALRSFENRLSMSCTPMKDMASLTAKTGWIPWHV